MIGTHNSFTYLECTNSLYNAFGCYWRCQEISIKEQYDMGVRVFDIRVSYTHENGKLWWQVGHGFAKVKQKFVNLENICVYFKTQYKGSYVRIMLEDGADDENVLNQFKTQSKKIVNKYSNMIWTIYIKRPWECLYECNKFTVQEYCCYLFNWDVDASLSQNIKNFSFEASSIKKWARNHNPEITEEMIVDPNKIYFMDYVNLHK